MNLFFRVIIDLLLLRQKSTSISQSQSKYLFLQHRHESNSNLLNPNKAGLFEGSIFWGDQFDPYSYFKKNLSNINKTVCNC